MCDTLLSICQNCSFVKYVNLQIIVLFAFFYVFLTIYDIFDQILRCHVAIKAL